MFEHLISGGYVTLRGNDMFTVSHVSGGYVTLDGNDMFTVSQVLDMIAKMVEMTCSPYLRFPAAM